MATYESYKQLRQDQIPSGTFGADQIATGAGVRYNTLWIYNQRLMQCHQCAKEGGCCCQYCGACCLWTVPSKVTRVTFEIWSGGGGGAGHTCCNCCSFSIGGAGGNYAIKTIDVTPSHTYTVCAGGTWPCNKSHTCTGGVGCRSYVTGCNLSNFCVDGGCGGWMCNGDAWGPRHHGNGCSTCLIFGADFGIMGTAGFKPGHGGCHCWRVMEWTGTAPIIGLSMASSASEYWCTCACFTGPPAGGGMSGLSSYCGNVAKCCAGGTGGGSGVVRITYA